MKKKKDIFLKWSQTFEPRQILSASGCKLLTRHEVTIGRKFLPCFCFAFHVLVCVGHVLVCVGHVQYVWWYCSSLNCILTWLQHHSSFLSFHRSYHLIHDSQSTKNETKNISVCSSQNWSHIFHFSDRVLP